MKDLVARIQRLVAWFMATRLGRTITRYGDQRGELLANGLSFSAIFSIFAGIYIVFAILGLWLSGHPVLLDSLLAQLNVAVPGLIDTGDGGAIPVAALTETTILGWTGVIAVLGLLITALGWVDAIRSGVRVMFAQPGIARNPILAKVFDLGLALLFVVLVAASAAITVLASTGIAALLDYLRAEDSAGTAALSRGVGLLLALLINTISMVIILKLVAQVDVPLKPALVGALIGGIGLTVIQSLGTLLLGGATNNPLLASFAVIVGLMIWFALISRVILYTAAWLAVAHQPDVAPDPQASESTEASISERAARVADKASTPAS